jgi:rod shape determining protein RodA
VTRGRWLDVPWLVPATAGALLVLGLLFVRSSTSGTSIHGLEWRQLKVIVASLPVLLLASALSHRRLARLAFALYAAGLASLVLVLFVGVNVGGARRWFDTPFDFRVQPSELMKPALVLALARWLEFRPEPDRLRDLAVPLLLTLVPFTLVRIEPDLGTALLFLPIPAAMLWAAGARRLHYVAAAALVVLLTPALYFSPLLEEYQRERVTTFLRSAPQLAEEALAARRAAADGTLADEQRAGLERRARALEQELADHKLGAGYQSHCAQTSIGSGGLAGKGLGQGPQNRLSYLPARHTDFIFAVVAEEWGFVGSCAIVGIFLLLGLGLLSVAAGTRDRFCQLVCVGAAASLVPQAFANLAMASGLIPVTGIPLPFLSQGGSSVMSSFALLGIVIAAARSRRDAEPFLYRSSEPVDPFDARAAAAPVRDLAP